MTHNHILLQSIILLIAISALLILLYCHFRRRKENISISLCKLRANRVKRFESITLSIEHQYTQLDDSPVCTEASQSFACKRKFILKKYVETVTGLAAESIANGALQEYPDFLLLLDKSLVNYLTQRPSIADLRFAYDTFLKPVMKGIVEHKYYKLSVGHEMATHLHDAILVYHDILTHKEMCLPETSKLSNELPEKELQAYT